MGASGSIKRRWWEIHRLRSGRIFLKRSEPGPLAPCARPPLLGKYPHPTEGPAARPGARRCSGGPAALLPGAAARSRSSPGVSAGTRLFPRPPRSWSGPTLRPAGGTGPHPGDGAGVWLRVFLWGGVLLVSRGRWDCQVRAARVSGRWRPKVPAGPGPHKTRVVLGRSVNLTGELSPFPESRFPHL